jgi:hypothetical protein
MYLTNDPKDQGLRGRVEAQRQYRSIRGITGDGDAAGHALGRCRKEKSHSEAFALPVRMSLADAALWGESRAGEKLRAACLASGNSPAANAICGGADSQSSPVAAIGAKDRRPRPGSQAE